MHLLIVEDALVDDEEDEEDDDDDDDDDDDAMRGPSPRYLRGARRKGGRGGGWRGGGRGSDTLEVAARRGGRPPPRTHFCTNSEPTMRMKQAVVALATALASMVLPVPGGPYMSTPRGGSMPICA